MSRLLTSVSLARFGRSSKKSAPPPRKGSKYRPNERRLVLQQIGQELPLTARPLQERTGRLFSSGKGTCCTTTIKNDLLRRVNARAKWTRRGSSRHRPMICARADGIPASPDDEEAAPGARRGSRRGRSGACPSVPQVGRRQVGRRPADRAPPPARRARPRLPGALPRRRRHVLPPPAAQGVPERLARRPRRHLPGGAAQRRRPHPPAGAAPGHPLDRAVLRHPRRLQPEARRDAHRARGVARLPEQDLLQRPLPHQQGAAPSTSPSAATRTRASSTRPRSASPRPRSPPPRSRTPPSSASSRRPRRGT